MTTKDEIMTEIQERLDEIEMLTLKAESGADWAEIARQEAEVMELKKDMEWMFRPRLQFQSAGATRKR